MTSSGPVTADVVVVGGGVVGLSIAWYLRLAGCEVVVLEHGTVGGQATGAAAGMLAPLAEAKSAGPSVDLGLASLRLYPKFVEALRAESGIDSELVGSGMLRVALNEAEVQSLRYAYVRQKTAGLPLEWLDGEEARRLEPAITVETCAATISTTEKHVEARRLARSLALGGARRGVRIREHTPVTGFTTAGRRVTEVCTPGGRISCGTVVVAGGAWSGAIGEMLHAELPVFPIRGQILALSCMPPPVRHTIYTHDGYLVPKADGRLMVGSTEDEAGFDTRPSAGGILKLLSAAVRLVPALAGAPFDSAWAGLRPASADGLPILGPLPEWENAHVATGHFRNGILLAPITGEIVSHGILTGEPHALLSAFVAGRFTQKQAAR